MPVYAMNISKISPLQTSVNWRGKFTLFFCGKNTEHAPVFSHDGNYEWHCVMFYMADTYNAVTTKWLEHAVL